MKVLKWIRNNIDLKVWAVIISLIVWFHVATERTYDTNYTARLEFVNPPKGWTIVGEPPEEISLRLRGTGKQLISHRLYGEPLATVQIPMSKERRVPVELDPNHILLARKGNVEIVNIVSPTKFDIEMDTLARKMVRIVPVVEDDPKDGFVPLGKPTADPPEVELVGGRSGVRRIVELRTVPISIRGEARNVERKAAISLPPGAGYRSKPDSVTVFVTIEKVSETAVGNITVEVENLGKGRSVTVKPQTAVVRLSGAESRIDALDPSIIRVSLDLADKGIGNHVVSPKVTRPDYFQVLSVEPNLFSVDIE